MNKKSFILLILIFLLFLVGIYLFKNDNNLSTKVEKKPNKTTVANNKEQNPKDDDKLEVSEAKLTLVGDFLFEQPFYDDNKDIEKSNYFKLVEKYFKDDDLSIGNLETIIGNDQLEISGSGYSFCAPESVGKLISKLDLQVLSTANNHAYDRSVAGVNSTIDFFKKNTKIMTVGTFKEESDLEKLSTLTINNIKFGFLSYTLGTNSLMKKENRFRVNLYRDQDTKQINDEFKAKIKNDVEKLKKETDVTIVLIHWGKEFTNTPNEEQEFMANYLNSLGVDIIVGNHSHSIQPIKYVGDKHKTLVYYSLGNFVSADDDIERTGEKFDNAYQFGILSTLKVTKENDSISIGNITTEPIINYYDKDMKNFQLIPYSNYTEDLEKSHYRYTQNFNKNFIDTMYKEVIDEEFRKTA